jgi:predicted N-acetyltransferase YhbS
MTSPRSAAPLRLRRARPSDAPAIARVMRAAIRGLAAPFHPPRLVAAWSSLPPLYHAWAMSAGGERYLVAERAGRVVGYAARRGREVTAVFVTPGHARAGIGAALLAPLEREARRAGERSMLVRAAPGATPFYAALGYRGSRRSRVPLPGGGALPAVLMRKRLSSRS